jgi:hypothetical protein
MTEDDFYSTSATITVFEAWASIQSTLLGGG